LDDFLVDAADPAAADGVDNAATEYDDDEDDEDDAAAEDLFVTILLAIRALCRCSFNSSNNVSDPDGIDRTHRPCTCSIF